LRWGSQGRLTLMLMKACSMKVSSWTVSSWLKTAQWHSASIASAMSLLLRHVRGRKLVAYVLTSMNLGAALLLKLSPPNSAATARASIPQGQGCTLNALPERAEQAQHTQPGSTYTKF
jgi:hypothetical protein